MESKGSSGLWWRKVDLEGYMNLYTYTLSHVKSVSVSQPNIMNILGHVELRWSPAVKWLIAWAFSHQPFALEFLRFLDSCEYIIMGTHKEGGATTFWSYIQNLPLSSNSMISWKFCYLLHKVLRDGHRNVSLNLYIPSTELPTSFLYSLLCM